MTTEAWDEVPCDAPGGCPPDAAVQIRRRPGLPGPCRVRRSPGAAAAPLVAVLGACVLALAGSWGRPPTPAAFAAAPLAGRRWAPPPRTARSLVARAADITVSDLVTHLREKGLPKGPKAEKLADLFANLLVYLEDAIGTEAVAAATTKAKKANGIAKGHDEGEDLFAQLMKLSPEVAKEDYFDESDGTWDVDGLKDDIQIHLDAGKEEKHADSPGEKLFAELLSLNSDASKEDYFDADAGEWDIDGLKDDISIQRDAAKKKAPAAKGAAAKQPVAEDEGEHLFEQLLAVAPESSREDYYDSESEEWDIDGLKSDLQAVKTRAAQSKPSASKAGGKKDAEAEQMLAKLIGLSPQSSKEDYFDESTGEWDMDGLRDDLALAMKHDKPSSGKQDPERLFEQLLELAPETKKEDYYDEDAEEWDIDALSEDLSITREKLGDPQALFDELLEYHPDATKEDYYDEDAGEWDMDGLRDDLKIAKEEAVAA